MNKNPPVKLTITAATGLGGKVAPVGAVVTVDDALARQLLRRERAEIFDPAKAAANGKPLTAAQVKAAAKAEADAKAEAAGSTEE
jgi:hypothetical protein